MESKEAKFTPGPWMYRPNPGSSKEDWTFHIDRQGTPGRMNWGILIAACWGHVSESAEASARLIAAAPALYDAAVKVLADLNTRIDLATNTGEGVPVFDGIGDLHNAIRLAEGADALNEQEKK